MLWLTFFILLVLWLLGLIGTYAIGAWLHLLLVLAIIVLIIHWRRAEEARCRD